MEKRGWPVKRRVEICERREQIQPDLDRESEVQWRAAVWQTCPNSLSCHKTPRYAASTKAIIDYVEKIRRTLHSYLDSSLPLELKEDLLLTDNLEDAVAPMCSELNEHVGYDPEVRLCTVTRDKVVWHREEVESAGFEKNDELIVIDEYGKTMTLEELHFILSEVIK